MPNNRAAASPKNAPCRFEELMKRQLTEDERKVQRIRRYRRPGRTLPPRAVAGSKWGLDPLNQFQALGHPVPRKGELMDFFAA